MVDVGFAIEGARVEAYAAVPTLSFRLRLAANAEGDCRIQNILLACQIRIEATRRRYLREEQDRLRDLFGEAHRFEESLRSMLWTQTTLQVPAFTGECCVDLPVACSFDLEVAAVKYFYGLENGEVPLSFLFSGTIFCSGPDDSLEMCPIPWNKEAGYRLPVRIWREAIDLHYPNGVWLRIDRDLFEQLYRLKRSKGFTGWNGTLRSLLRPGKEESVS